MSRNVNAIPERAFGSSGPEVSLVGLGGEGVLRTFGREEAAVDVIETALAEGVTYFDSARAYSGSEGYYGLVWPRRPADRDRIFQTSKSALRTKREAMQELESTLGTMGTDHLDLWQIHDVRTHEDLQQIEGPGGALEAFVEAKAAGKTRFIGVTGHHDPSVLTKAVREWPVDAVLLPVNPVEGLLGGFLDQTLPAARGKGLAVIGMKVLGASHYLVPKAGVDAGVLIRYALSQPVTLVIVGCSSPAEVAELTGAGRRFTPMTEEEQERVLALYRPYARKLAYYRGVI